MYLSLSVLALGATVSSVGAAFLPVTTRVHQVANYDDIPGLTPLVGEAPPAPYKGLSYTAFGVGASAPGALSLQASSKPNFAFAPYLLVDPLATPEITSSYSGSKVVSFDMESIASGCYAATEQGAAAPPISCTIRYTGTKVSGEEVTFDAVFTVKNLNLLGIALAGEAVQTQRFPSSFKGITSLKPKILTAAIPAIDGVTAQMGFDDLVYTTYVKK